jgi:hypothetical protein
VGESQYWTAGSGIHLARPLAAVVLFATLFIFGALPAKATDLANDTIRLDLETTSNGVPVIAGANWKTSGKPIFADTGLAGDLSSWVPDSVLPAQNQTFDPAVWSVTQDDKFIVARASLSLPSSLKVTWVIELAKSGSLFRLHVDYQNARKKRMAIEWFPAWSASWTVPASPDQIRWWDALAYTPEQKPATKKANVNLFSHLYSSAARDGGSLPYWVVDAQWGKLYFGLSWSGGWQAQIHSKRNVLAFSVSLPPEETELVLDPGESVEGPRLVVTPATHPDNLSSRRFWMDQRAQLGKVLYGGPAPSFPLAYNHWYAVRTDVSPDFLRSQIQAMGPYGFDAFVVDAGWYDSAGNWLPDPAKFQPGELEAILQSAKSAGATPGLWSAPQYVLGQNNQAPAGIADPGSFNALVDGYLLDLWKGDYKTRLLDHIQSLTQRFPIGWWKYDQPIFDVDATSGAMRTVLAFQTALRSVRRANPNLIIENCQDGGHMINEQTLLATQLSWLLDVPGNDLPDARSNVQVTLGALETVFPWSAYRWTNNLDQHQDDDEFTRYYCRSAMAGVWGISTDLSKINDHQRSIILNEIQNYRRLNGIKKYDQYEIVQPADGADAASVTFYGRKNQEAAAIVYRWDAPGSFNRTVCLKGLDKSISYVITDADTGAQTTMSGQDLSKQGYPLSFDNGRLSGLLFVEPARQ